MNNDLSILDLIQRKPVPEPWEEGENIPWNDPSFSTRMLEEHLSQSHDAASRRFPKVDEHIQWIHSGILKEYPTRVLDICCGPGIYTSRLATRGHKCVGIDFAPAAIAYAREQAQASHLECEYIQSDVRQADFGTGFGLAMVLYGQINVFRQSEAQAILQKARHTLVNGGILALEAHTLDVVERMGKEPPSWYSAKAGLFSDQPHLVMEEHFWDTTQLTATTRFYVINAFDATVTRYAMTTQGYTNENYSSLLQNAGFTDISTYPSLTGTDDPNQPHFVVLVAKVR